MATPPKGAVRGTFNKGTCINCTDPELLANLSASNVWCAWDKGHVILHINFVNHESAHVTVRVQPAYRIRNGGVHNAGFTAVKSVGINAGAFRSWFGDLGKPDGVAVNTPISICGPSLSELSIG